MNRARQLIALCEAKEWKNGDTNRIISEFESTFIGATVKPIRGVNAAGDIAFLKYPIHTDPTMFHDQIIRTDANAFDSHNKAGADWAATWAKKGFPNIKVKYVERYRTLFIPVAYFTDPKVKMN